MNELPVNYLLHIIGGIIFIYLCFVSFNNRLTRCIGVVFIFFHFFCTTRVDIFSMEVGAVICFYLFKSTSGKIAGVVYLVALMYVAGYINGSSGLPPFMGVGISEKEAPLKKAMNTAGFISMRTRYDSLRSSTLNATFEGYEKTGQPLVEYHVSGGKEMLAPSGSGDDPGMFYFIPMLARWKHITPGKATTLFFFTILHITIIGCLAGFFLAFRTWLGRLAGVAALMRLVAMMQAFGGVYIIQAAVIAVLLPPTIFFIKSKAARENTALVACFLIFSGLCCGTAGLLRSLSGAPVILFTLTMIFFYIPGKLWKKGLLSVLLIICFLIPGSLMARVTSGRDAYLEANTANYKRHTASHVLWHTAYVGFGFVFNENGYRWEDSAGYEKAREISPEVVFYSKEYEDILKKETFKIITGNPFYAATVFAAKLGIMIFFALIFMDIGFFAALKNKFEYQVPAAFLAGALLSAANGIVGIPDINYVQGLIAFAMIFGVYSINAAIEGDKR